MTNKFPHLRFAYAKLLCRFGNSQLSTAEQTRPYHGISFIIVADTWIYGNRVCLRSYHGVLPFVHKRSGDPLKEYGTDMAVEQTCQLMLFACFRQRELLNQYSIWAILELPAWLTDLDVFVFLHNLPTFSASLLTTV